MGAARHDDVRPDLIGEDDAVVCGIDLHGLLDLPALPDPSGGIVGGAENGQMDPVLPELPVHVLVVHAPDALGVPDEIAVDRFAAGALQHMGEADVGGRVEQDLLSGRGEHADGGAHAAQDPVFIADVFFFQIRDALAVPMPVQNSLIVGLRLPEIAEVGEADPLLQRLQDAGHKGSACNEGQGVYAQVCQALQRVGKLLRGEETALIPMGNISVLAIDAAQRAARKKDSAGSAAA